MCRHVDGQVLGELRSSRGTCFVSWRSWIDTYLEASSMAECLESPFSMEFGSPGVEACMWGPQCPIWTLDSRGHWKHETG